MALGQATLKIHYEAQIFVTKQDAEQEARAAGQASARLMAQRNAPLLGCFAPQDVVFYFPRSGRELWANSKALRKASPYFATLLDSGFSESKPAAATAPADGAVEHNPDETPPASSHHHEAPGVLGWVARRVETAVTSAALIALVLCLRVAGLAPSTPASSGPKQARRLSKDAPWQDSDDESDRVPLQLAATRTAPSPPAGVREIVITSAAYTTYFAVLTWIHYDFIEFAPLSSTSLAAAVSPPLHLLATDPNLPLPASPKCVYALADYLELPELMRLALDDFSSKLSPDNVLYQLASDAALYDDICDAIIAFARANSAAVKTSRAATELRDGGALEALGMDAEAVGQMKELIEML